MSGRVPDLVVIAGASEPALMETTIRDLLAAAADAAIAVEHVRLPALQRVIDALEKVDRCRLILARLDVHMLDAPATTPDSNRQAVERLLTYASSGRLEIRSAGAIRWDPDFSLYRMRDGRLGTFCLFGAHYLAPPHQGIDWPLTCMLTRRTAVRRITTHFEEVWSAAHDVIRPVTETLERQLCVSSP